jgi:ABC-2 type transport system ATP-binding protein
VEFAEKESLNVLREIPGIKTVLEYEKSVEIFPEEGTNIQTLLEELVHKAEILRFERALPSLNEIFIKIVEDAANE